MADINRTIEIIFGAVDQTGSALNSVSSGLTKLDDSIGSITQPLSDLGDLVLKTEAALIAMGAAMVGVAVNQAGTFASQINEIGTLFGGTGEQIAAFSKDVITYGQQSSQSFGDITGAIYSAVSAGTDYTNSLDLLNEAEKLSIAGKADLNSTIVTLASTLNAYGEETDQATKYSDILFNTVRLGQTTLPELANSLSQVTAIAAAADIPIETLSAAIAALTAYGVPTAQAMTSIKAAISNIITPSKQAADLANQLGIEFNATALQTQGFEGVLKSATEATGGSVEQMALLFGSVEGLKAALALGLDVGGKFANALNEMANAAGATAEAYEIMKDNMSLVNQNIINNLQATLIAAGLPLLDEYGDAGRALAGVFQSLTFSIGEGAFDPVLDAIQQFGADAAVYLNGIADVLPTALSGLEFGPLLESFTALGDSISGLFQGLDLTNAEDLRSALQFIIDTVRSLTNVTAGIVQGWNEAISAADGWINKLVNASSETQIATGFGLGLAQVYEQLRKVIGPLIDAVDAFGTALTIIAGVLTAGRLITAFGLWGEAMAGIISILSGPLGIIALVGGLAAALFTFSGNAEAAVEPQKTLTDLMKELEPPAVNVAKAINELNANLDAMVKSTTQSGDEFEQQVGLATAWDDALVKLNASLASSNQKIDEAGNVTSTLQEYTDKSLIATSKLGVSYNDAGKAVQEFGDGLTGIKTKFKESADSAEEATKKSDDYLLKMEEIASNERIAVIKGTFELDIAKLEAQADVAVAIIEGLGDTISSTGQVLTSLFDLLTDPNLSVSALFDIQRQIDFENKLREQAAQDQSDLAQAQIAVYQAQVDSYRNGTPLFSVSADGVEPELRQLLFKLLELIQVEASGSYGNFLLALNP